jgi:GAF domain-containing protein
MVPASTESGPFRLGPVLRSAVQDLHRASGADLTSLFLYDAEARRYYAPFAVGLPEDGLLASLTDMGEQLAAYQEDLAAGKVPGELRPQHYGTTVWLTVTRRLLVARDATAEADSSFVRRHQVASSIGLPLLSGDTLLGLAYLSYKSKEKFPDAKGLKALEQWAGQAGRDVEQALAAAERAALEGLNRMAQVLAAPPAGPSELRRLLSIALADTLPAAELDGAAIYQPVPHRARLELVTAHAPLALPLTIDLVDGADRAAAFDRALAAATAKKAVFPAGTIALEDGSGAQGYLVGLSRDRLAAARRAPATDVLLEGAAALIGGVLYDQRLVAGLESRTRLLGALADMTSSMLQPGASRQDVLDAVVGHLTDAAVPEFDFHFATVYVLDERDPGMVVSMAAGAAPSAAIDAAQTKAARIPRWALEGERKLADDDVLVYAARSWQAVIVGPQGEGTEDVIAGRAPEHSRWVDVPVVRADGTIVTTVPACLIGQTGADRHLAAFTLAGELWESSGHGELIRIFQPFGMNAQGRATGVLEVGYHRSHDRRPDWAQVEALRAAAAQVAVAVQTAGLYEEARHHAEQLELSAGVSEAIASSIDLDQTLRLVARNLVRLVDASLCQIALYEEDREGWFGAAASDQEELWQRQRGERSQPSFLFEVLDKGQPLLVEDAPADPLVGPAYADAFGVRSLLALPLIADGQPIGAAVLAQRHRHRVFTKEEVQLAQGLSHQAAVAIKNARLHALAEEERHLQKDFVLVGLGQWGQKAYGHLQTLKQFFNFRIHLVERDGPEARGRLAAKIAEVEANGDILYWDSAESPAHEQLAREMESSSYVITYIATPAATHLPTLGLYYDLSDVVLIEKPLGAPPDDYRKFLDQAPGGVEIVAADHYYFKLEVRLLQMLLTEERTLRNFLDSVSEITIEILEEQPLVGAAADIGVVADLVPHAFAIISLLTPIDRIRLDTDQPLVIGRHEGLQGTRESFARLTGSFPYQGRSVRLVIEVGKGIENAKWIKLSGERPLSGRSPFYKFDFGQGEAVDGTQSSVRAAVRRIREPGVPDNAHLNMLRHVIEKRRPAVGILSIREAIRANQRIRDLEAMADDLLTRKEWVEYPIGVKPSPSPRGRVGVGQDS